MGMEFSEFRNKLRLPSWQKADIEAELAAHLQEAVADLRVQGVGEAEAQTAALARFGDLDSLAESLQEIHKDWKGGATVQRRLFRVVSIAVIVGFVLVLLVLPNFREFFRFISWQYDPWSRLVSKDNALKQFSRDLYVQTYLAETDSFAKVSTAISAQDPAAAEKQITEAIKRFEPVFMLASESPAPHQRLAMLLIEHLSLARAEVYESLKSTDPNYDRILRSLPKERSPLEQLLLRKAIEQLQIASRLFQENAAPDYLLAYAYFANRQDAKADEVLRAAIRKPGWDLYDDELRYAQGQTFQARGRNLIAQIASYATRRFWTQSHLKELTRLLSELAREKRAAGASIQADFYLTAAIHLGDLMLRQADADVDLLVAANSISAIAGSFVDAQERAAIKALPISRQDQGTKITEVGAKKLIAYLDAQGREELSRQYQRDLSAARELKNKIRSVHTAFESRMMSFWGSSWLGPAFLTYWQALGSLGLLLVIGLISLPLRHWREKRAAPLWRWWEWLELMLLIMLPPNLSAYIIAHSSTEKYATSFFDYGTRLPLLIAAISFVVVLGLVIIGTLLKRRRQNPEMRLGKFRAVIASLRILLLPTAAALLLGTLLLSLPAQGAFHRFATEQQGIFQKGEVEYWGIGLPEK